MWICSNCGSQCDADFCATCGKPRESGSSGVHSATGYTAVKPSGRTNKNLELIVAMLLLIGIIILLFTPLVRGSDYGTSYSYNVQQLYTDMNAVKEQAQYYADLLGSYDSEVQQAMSTINSIIFALFTVIGLLYASALIIVINFFKKMPRLYTAARWISLSVGICLLLLLIYAKSQIDDISSGYISSLISSYAKLGFFGIIAGLILIGAAMLLYAKPELLFSVSITKIREATGLQWRCTNPSCGHMNSGESIFCSVCGTRKGPGTVAVPPNTWKCSNPSCGHANLDGSFFCTKCGTPKNAAPAVTPPSTWSCANGHMNTSDSRFCSICGIEKSAVVTRPRSQWRCSSCGRENGENLTVCAYCHKPKNWEDSSLLEKNPEF